MKCVAVLTLDNLCKSFRLDDGRVLPIVQDLNLNVDDGELVVMLGRTGCGKTTTLRMIAGLESPDSGAVAIDGRDVNVVPARDRDVAMVMQGGALFPHLNVFDNVALGPRLRHEPGAETERRVGEVLEMLGLQHHADAVPATLSGGERQRVALGRALVRRPELLLLDEPFVHLDGPVRRELRREVLRWQRELKLTCILVTHDQAEALALGSRVAVMNAGRIEQIDTPGRLMSEPATPFVVELLDSRPL
jgi:ABC-type sugar transport system ATPase subunit